MDEKKTDTIDLDQLEREFADQVMKENQQVFEQLTERAGG